MAVMPPVTFLLLVITIFWMWQNYVHPPSLVGEVEAVRATVISTVAGTVLELKVDELQPVTNGQPLAVVSVIEPETMQAELTAIESDLQLTKARMAVDVDRNTQNFDQMRLQLMSDRVQLAIDQTNLNLAESEFNRAEQLFNSKTLISEAAYEAAKAKRDALRVTVAERTTSVSEMGKTLATYNFQLPDNNAAIAAALRAQQDRLTQLEKPLVLKAPMSGFVSVINNHAGDRISAGQPVLAISGNRADRIIGWVRQPVFTKPSAGDVVEVRSYRTISHVTQAVVIAVGDQLEPVSSAALPFNAPVNRVEYGLQFLARVPPGSDLIPGEMVGLILKGKPASRASN